MKLFDRHLKIVEWSEEDGCYIGRCPELMLGGVHGADEIQVYRELCVVLHQKKATYARHGVQEYLVLQVNEKTVSWFSLADGNYDFLATDADGIFRSRIFPGLWFHAAAFWADHMAAVLAVLQQGLASPEHGAFLEQLSKR